jgi:hypothetical protein
MTFSAKELIIRSKDALSSNEARRLKKQLILWRDVIADWLEVISFVDYEHSGSNVEQADILRDCYLVPSAATKKHRRVISKLENSVTIIFNARSGISKEQLSLALKKSMLGYHPLPQFLFLISGLKYLNKKKYRECVLDAATAFEMVLTILLERRLASVSAAQKQLIEIKYKQIMNLYAALKSLGERLPVQNDVQTKVAEPRNRAIHEGQEILENEARDALNLVKRFTYQKFPVR